MKRVILSLAALLLLLALVAWLPCGLPQAEEFIAITEGNNEVTYAVQNAALTSSIYTLKEGTVQEVHREPRVRGTRSFSINALAMGGTQLYSLRQWDDGIWEVAGLTDHTAVFSQTPLDPTLTPTGLLVQDQIFYITAVTSDGFVQVLTMDSGGTTALDLLLPAPLAGGVAWAAYDGTRIRAALPDGKSLFLSLEGQGTFDPTAAEPTIETISLPFTQWLECKLYPLLSTAVLWLAATVITFALLWYCRRAKQVSARITAAATGIILATVVAANGLLIWELVRVNGAAVLPGALLRYGLSSIGILVVSLFLLRFVSSRITRPIGQMAAQMDRMADGDVSIRKIEPGLDELHRMHQSLQELCMSLSIRDYELKNTVEAYYRFIPSGLTQILNRASVAEVDYGDSRRMEGTVGLFSVSNRTSARNLPEDAQYVHFVNHSFQLLDDCMKEHNGCLLSGSLELSCMKVLFTDAASGVRAAISYLGQARAKREADLPAPDMTILFHTASFLYGVTGSTEKLFPYLSSSELEFLGGFAPRFHETGVRVVVTEPYHQLLTGSGFSTRYIGFLSFAERGYAFKLYEVLDAYPELERNLRLRYNQRLQEAIHLFYRNDFYLARNLFSNLLRACPEDGIVRWYLFACEHYFSREGGGEVDYQLFGILE